MGKLKFTLSNIFLWIGLLVTCVILENTSFLTPNMNAPLSNSYFYLLLAIGIFSYACLFIFEHVFNKTKFDLVLLIGLTIFFVSGTVAIWLFKDGIINEVEVTIDISTKIRYTLSFMMFILTLYVILFIFVKNTITFRNFRLAYIGAIIFSLVAIIYSLITEFEVYKDIFTGNSINGSITSFFWNSNMYVATLYFGTIAAIMLNIMKKNVLWYLAIIIFAFGVSLTVSSLSLVSEILLLFFYMLVEIILSFKKHPIRSGILLGIHISLTAAFVLLGFFGRDMDNFIGHVFTRIYHEIFETNQSSRDAIWASCTQYVISDPVRLIFGNGFGVAAEINRALSHVNSAHNGFIQILFNYGIVGCLAYLSIVVYFFFGFFRMFKVSRRLACLFTLIGISLFGYAVGESIIIFNSNAMGTIVGGLFYLPLIIETKNYMHQQNREIILSEKNKLGPIGNLNLLKTVAIVCLFLFCLVFPLIFIRSIQLDQKLLYIVIALSASLFVTYLMLPYIVSLWTKSVKPKKLLGRILINVAVILAVLGLFILFGFIWENSLPACWTYFIPGGLALVYIVEIMVYSYKNGGSFKIYLTTLKTLVLNCVFAVGFTCLISILINVLFVDYFEFTLLYIAIILVMNIAVFSAGYLMCGLGDNHVIIDYFNKVNIHRLRKNIIKNEIRR